MELRVVFSCLWTAALARCSVTSGETESGVWPIRAKPNPPTADVMPESRRTGSLRFESWRTRSLAPESRRIRSLTLEFMLELRRWRSRAAEATG